MSEEHTAELVGMEEVSRPDDIHALYVQSAAGVAYEDGRLSLKGIAPTTLFFLDRPGRVTGHIPMDDFLASWGEGDNSFADDPPNAVLSTFSQDVNDVVVVLQAPVLERDGTQISYEIEILDGDMPASGGLSSLFIDVVGRPLTPVSAPGHAGRRAGEGCSANPLKLLITKAGGAFILPVRVELPIVSQQNWDHFTPVEYPSAHAYQVQGFRRTMARQPDNRMRIAEGGQP
jgi:hypothetical protein